MQDYRLALIIFAMNLAAMVAWNLAKGRLSERQMEGSEPSPLLRFLVYVLFSILIAALIAKIVHELRSL